MIQIYGFAEIYTTTNIKTQFREEILNFNVIFFFEDESFIYQVKEGPGAFLKSKIFKREYKSLSGLMPSIIIELA